MKNLFKSITIIFAIAAISIATSVQADNSSGISISSYVSDQISNFPAEAKSILNNKLSQIVAQNGITNGMVGSRFIITPNISVMERRPQGGPPPMTVFKLEITFYIGDGIEGRKFAAKTISLTGVGENENKAYIDAIRNIQPDNAELAALIAEGKKKIMDYYNGNCDNIIKASQAAASKSNYEEAIATLTGVPDACQPCYDKALAAAQPMYKKFIDQQCGIKLNEAKAAWNANQNSQGAAKAGEILSAIDPSANPVCYNEVKALHDKITKRMEELGDKEWALKNKLIDAKVEVEKSQNAAAAEVAKARWAAYNSVASSYYYSRHNLFVYNIRGWW